jgi:hypothetical protein
MSHTQKQKLEPHLEGLFSLKMRSPPNGRFLPERQESRGFLKEASAGGYISIFTSNMANTSKATFNIPSHGGFLSHVCDRWSCIGVCQSFSDKRDKACLVFTTLSYRGDMR